MFKQIHQTYCRRANIITRQLVYIPIFILFISGYQTFAQSGLHFSEHELKIWRQRINDGPYKSIPSKTLSNTTVYEGGWEGLIRNKNTFSANPAQARWIVSPFPPVKDRSNNPPLKASKRMSDAAFVALVENDVALANLVRDHLLWQAQESTTDFTNTTAWQRTYNHIGEVQPNLVGSNWGLSHVYAYDYIKDLAELTPEQKNIILSWLRGMGEYYMAVSRAAIDLLFINPYSNDYRLTSYARSMYNNYPGTVKTHANGYVIQNLHKFFNNRRYSLVRCAAMVGVLLNDASLKDRASRCFKEYIKYGMYPDGMISDYEKAFDASGAPADPNQGWKYAIVPLAVLTDIADAFARSGDKSLFEYQTSEGVLGSEGGTKSLRKGIVTFCKHVDGQTLFDEGVTLHYQDGFLGDNTRIISTNNIYNRDNRFTSFHDIVTAMANLYYKDSYVQGTYMRTNPGSPPFNTASVVVEVGGHDNIDIWGGGFDGMPDILFMYGQMEDKYNPYTNIAINSPADKSTFTTDNNIIIEVTAIAPNTSVSKVEFYNGTTKLGEVASSPYSYTWANPPAGNYTLTAKAIDNTGAVANSSPIDITVKLPNQVPSISVISPVAGTKFIAPATITIDAATNDTDGTISKVEFFEGTTVLGEDTDGSNGWNYTWTNIAIGSYSITAKVTDNEGATATSAVVNIDIKAPNQSPVVNAGIDQTVTLPVNWVQLTGTASDPDGKIVTYAWSKQSGPTASLNGVDTETLTVNDLLAGSYVFRLETTDDEGVLAYDEVGVFVNTAPAISISSPANNTTFTAPASVTVTANASDSDGSITKVELFQGTTKLGEDTDGSNGWNYTWTNIAAGTYSLTAKATDNVGAVTTSSPVSITVNTAPVAQSVVNFTLINADTEQAIRTLINGDELNLAILPTRNLNIRANTNPVTVVSVVFNLTGTQSKTITETGAPYALYGDVSGNYNPWTPAIGSYTLTGTPYSSSGGSGTQGTALTVSFKVVNINPPPTVSVTSPANNTTFTAPATINIAATASDANGTVSKVEFFRGTTKLGEDLTSPYSFSWTNAAAGTYSLTAKATDNAGAVTTSSPVSITVNTATTTCSATGTISGEYWGNVSGSSVTAIPLTRTPTSTFQRTSFEAQTNRGDNYGQRIRGYICAPANGSYTFYIAGDDSGELWLSTDANSANKRKIASVNTYTAVRQWTKFASQKSAIITLQAGRRYYIEALHKESTGGDNLAVGWIRPGSTTITVIPGSVLSSFTASTARLAMEEEATEELSLKALPNPFSTTTFIEFESSKKAEITLDLYDTKGILIRRLFTGEVLDDLNYQLEIDGRRLSSGLYYVRISTDKKSAYLKLVLSK